MSISRRQFCAAVGAAAFSAGACCGAALANDDEGPAFTVVAYNVAGCTGWPAERPRAKLADSTGRIAELLANELARYNPDIVTFSESPGEKVAKEVAQLLRMIHIRFPSPGSWPGTLLSRFEIPEARNVPLGYERPRMLFSRHWGRGILTLPKGESLIVHSAHLNPSTDSSRRVQEIKAMLASMQDDLQAGHSMLLMGDLSLKPDSEEYRLWIDAGWIDTFAQAGKGDGATVPADAPKVRSDYVMATGPIARRVVESRALFEGAFRLDTANPNAFALSYHVPQLARFSLES